VNPAGVGTKAAFAARRVVAPGATVEPLVAMAPGDAAATEAPLAAVAGIFEQRRAEADGFYTELAWPTISPAERTRPTVSRRKCPALRPLVALPPRRRAISTSPVPAAIASSEWYPRTPGVREPGRPRLGQAVRLADRGVEVDREGGIARSGTRPRPGEQFPADPVELADVAPAEAAQVRA
jgi:hypothetical protein